MRGKKVVKIIFKESGWDKTSKLKFFCRFFLNLNPDGFIKQMKFNFNYENLFNSISSNGNIFNFNP